MKDMKLITMTDFVLLRSETPEEPIFKLIHGAKHFELCENYANFLKQPLELWMFVPCDEDGKVFEEPEEYQKHLNMCGDYKTRTTQLKINIF